MMRMLLEGDCAEKMRDLAPNSVDAIVTDPPYGLAFMGANWDNFGGKSCGNDSIEERKRKAKEYRETHKGCGNYPNSHSSSPSRDEMANFQSAMTPIFAEALRVAKPGAHLLAFGGTRTYHRLACAIEDAGWEVRDCIMWVYGSGFPKSMDVAKSIDKAIGYEGEVIGSRIVDVGMQGGNMHAGRSSNLQEVSVRAASSAAQPWQGWGTCLKPAVEPIVVARKPLEGTVAANVLKFGTGAINIDGCRVPTDPQDSSRDGESTNGKDYTGTGVLGWQSKPGPRGGDLRGRFPANLIHDGSDEVLALFPDSKGQCGAVKGTEPSRTGSNGIYGNYGPHTACHPRDDSGSAARFFYCAKASRSERGDFNDHMTVKPLALMRYLVRLVTRKGGIVLDPFMGSGTTGVAAIQEGMHFIGIERDPHYYDIASRRIEDARPTPPTTTQEELPL